MITTELQELLDKKAKENNSIDLNAYALGLEDAHFLGYATGYKDGYDRAVEYVKRGIPLTAPEPITKDPPPNQLDIFIDTNP